METGDKTMGFTTIDNDERADKGVSGLSSTPNLTASALQQRFDSLANLALDKLIQLIKELEATTAGSHIGTPYGKLTAVITTIMQKLSALKDTDESLDERVTAIEKERLSEAIDQRVTEIENEDIPDIKADISQIFSTMSANNTTYMRQITGCQDDIANLKNYNDSTIVPKLMEIDDRSYNSMKALQDSSGNLISVQTALNAVNLQIENTQDDISNIESDLSSLGQSIAETDDLLSETNTKLRTAESNITKAQTSITTLQEQVANDIQTAISELENEIEETREIGSVVNGVLLLRSRATVSSGVLTL